MATITDDKIIETLIEIIEEKGPGYVYPDEEKFVPFGGGCRYTTDEGGPSCIVGQLIYRLSPGEFRKLHAYEVAFGTPVEVASLWDEVGVRVPGSRRIMGLLRELQKLQDDGEPWGAAFDWAIAHEAEWRARLTELRFDIKERD